MDEQNEKTSTRKNVKKTSSLVKKPSFQNKKPPEIKQTLTSKYRILKANPLLKLTMDSKALEALPQSVSNLNLSLHKTGELSLNSSVKQSILSRIDPLSNSSVKGHLKQCRETVPIEKAVKETMSSKVVKNNEAAKRNLVRSQSLKCTNNDKFIKPALLKRSVHLNSKSSSNLKNGSSGSRIISSNITADTVQKTTVNRNEKKVSDWLAQTTEMKTSKHNNEDRANKTSKSTKPKPIRRSLSAQHFDRKKGKPCNPESCVTRLDKSITQSFEDLRQTKGKRVMLLNTDISPIIEESRNVSFKTPSAYERRSIVFKTPNTSRKSLYHSFTTSPGLAMQDLHEKLNNWLKRNEKSLGSFHHLKCFGLQLGNVPDEENKENIEVIPDLRRGSYEDLGIINSDKNKFSEHNTKIGKDDNENLDTVAKDALTDLHKLITEGYPRNQCEAWLKVMHQKHKSLDREPQYWECRAALEEARGDISSAVECYKTAIIQGAEVHTVDESLDQLLQKFSLLNISTSEVEDKKSTRERARIIKDARNIFKSTIIQFAVQERTLKKQNSTEDTNNKKFLVTPVRRSTRLRRSAAYTSTPGMKICTKLQDLEQSVRESMDFHVNNALC